MHKDFPSVAWIEPNHISLSKCLILSSYQKEPFISSLRDQIKYCDAFKVQFDKVDVFINDDKSKLFIGLTVSAVGQRKSKQLVQSVNEIGAKYKLEGYYEEPQFHVSFGCSSSVDLYEDLKARLSDDRNSSYKALFKGYSLLIDSVNVKCATEHFAINLSPYG